LEMADGGKRSTMCAAMRSPPPRTLTTRVPRRINIIMGDAALATASVTTEMSSLLGIQPPERRPPGVMQPLVGAHAT
jgi:hypothetical protein